MSPADAAQTIEHRIGETGSLSVRLADWDVEVIAVDGDIARIRSADAANLPDGLEIQRHDNGIAIRQPNRSGLDLIGGRRSSTTRISIEIPTRTTASIQTASGDLQATGLRGPVESRTASGDVLLIDVAGEVQVETVSGDVAIRLAGRTTLAVKTVSGDCVIEGGEVDRFAFTTTSGDMRITSELGDGPHAIATVSGDAIVTTRNGIRISAQTVTGDLGSDLPHTSEGRPGRRSLIVGEGSTVVQFRSVSGDLRVVGPNGAEHLKAIPRPPAPPAPPTPPARPTPPAAPAFAATASATDAGTGSDPGADAGVAAAAEPDEPSNPAVEAVRLDILRALERGEMDIEEAAAKLSALDGQTDG
jgi:hypothetical protein